MAIFIIDVLARNTQRVVTAVIKFINTRRHCLTNGFLYYSHSILLRSSFALFGMLFQRDVIDPANTGTTVMTPPTVDRNGWFAGCIGIFPHVAPPSTSPRSSRRRLCGSIDSGVFWLWKRTTIAARAARRRYRCRPERPWQTGSWLTPRPNERTKYARSMYVFFCIKWPNILF